MNAIRDKLLTFGEQFNFGLGAVQEEEFRGLQLGERALRAIDQQDLWCPTDTDERCWGERGFDQMNDCVGKFLVEDVNIKGDDLAAQEACIERARIRPFFLSPLAVLGWHLRATCRAAAFRGF
jgi:hypothetical protein